MKVRKYSNCFAEALTYPQFRNEAAEDEACTYVYKNGAWWVILLKEGKKHYY